MNGVHKKLSAAGCDLVMFGSRKKLSEVEQALAHSKKAGFAVFPAVPEVKREYGEGS